MSTMQVKSILDRIRAYHYSLAAQLQTLELRESDQRIKLLLDYMARHEVNFEKSLATYEAETAKGILNTWLQYVPNDEISEALETLDFHDGMQGEEILATVLTFDRALVAMYRELADETPLPRIEELFKNLIQLEEGKDRQLSISVLEMYDD